MQDINEDNFLVGERIRSIRQNFNMSRDKFSEMIDVSEVFLGQVERGERALSLKTLKRIVAYTGYSSDYILYGDVKNNDKIKRVDRILMKCSEETIDYVYDFIHNSFTFLKKLNKKF